MPRFALFVPVFRPPLVALSAAFPARPLLLPPRSGPPALPAALVALPVFGLPRPPAVPVRPPARALR
ncbi:CARF domain-containing protein, partial [Mycobacterium tuberculosis]|uniref:CARF domain-containing protein n=1 Tax=Mycobacterium tuberculosis TaxID=1773 RepID=UPI003B641DDE